MNIEKNRKSQIGRLLIIFGVILFLVVGTLITREQPARSTTSTPGSARSVTYTAKEAAAGETENVMMSTAADDAEEAPAAVENGSEEAAAAKGDKLIRSASVSLKTTEFDTVLSSVRSMAASFGGRVESLSVYGDAGDGSRWGYLSVRVPAARLDEFLSTAEGLGKVTGYSEYTQDVSGTYYDLQSRLALQQAKLEKLQAMLPQATTVSEIVEIESAISDTQYYIDTYQGRLNGYDAKIDYSTVSIDINEVKEEEPEQEPTFFERIGTALKNSLEGGVLFLRDMLVFIVAALPWLAAAGVIALAVILIVRKANKQKPGQE